MRLCLKRSWLLPLCCCVPMCKEEDDTARMHAFSSQLPASTDSVCVWRCGGTQATWLLIYVSIGCPVRAESFPQAGWLLCLCARCFTAQVISFYTWQQGLQPAELLTRINKQLEAALPAAQPLRHSTSTGSLSGSNTAAAAATDGGSDGGICQLRVWHVSEVGRGFHAQFSASWRRYVYLLPLRQQQQQHDGAVGKAE